MHIYHHHHRILSQTFLDSLRPPFPLFCCFALTSKRDFLCFPGPSFHQLTKARKRHAGKGNGGWQEKGVPQGNQTATHNRAGSVRRARSEAPPHDAALEGQGREPEAVVHPALGEVLVAMVPRPLLHEPTLRSRLLVRFKEMRLAGKLQLRHTPPPKWPSHKL